LYTLFQTEEHQHQTKTTLSDMGVEWKFSVHSSFWWSIGSWHKIYEILLSKVHRNAYFSYEELLIIFTRVEAYLDSRPLTTISSDQADMSPSTPGHLLVSNSLTRNKRNICFYQLTETLASSFPIRS